MAEQSEASIPRVGKRKWGYDAGQVDEFLDRAHRLYDSEGVQLTQQDIQKASFKLTRGGYDIAQVDAALMRLERAVVDKQTTWEISQHGRVAWKAQTEDSYRQIARHASRAAGERFDEGAKGEFSYDRKQVDALTDAIVDKCAVELGLENAEDYDAHELDKITSEYVTGSVFTQRKGKKGYSERQVDYFLSACIQLLSRLESYERLAGYVAADETDAAAAEPVAAPAPAETGVTSLFSQGAQFQPRIDDPVETPHSFAPGGAAQSFEALSQAEQSLFTPKPPVVEQEAPVAPVKQPEWNVQPEQGIQSVQSEQDAQDVQDVQEDVPSVPTASAVQPVQPTQSVQPTPQPVQSVQPAQSVQPVPSEEKTPAAFTAASFAAPASAPTSASASVPTPAPTSVPAPAASTAAPAPASAAVSAAKPEEEGFAGASASLASLAHMVEATSQDVPAIDIPNLPQVPNLDAPNPFVSSSLPLSYAPAGQESANRAAHNPTSSATEDENNEQ